MQSSTWIPLKPTKKIKEIDKYRLNAIARAMALASEVMTNLITKNKIGCLTTDGEEQGKHGEEEEGNGWEQDNGDKDQTSDLASLSRKDELRSGSGRWRPKRRPRRPRAKLWRRRPAMLFSSRGSCWWCRSRMVALKIRWARPDEAVVLSREEMVLSGRRRREGGGACGCRGGWHRCYFMLVELVCVCLWRMECVWDFGERTFFFCPVLVPGIDKWLGKKTRECDRSAISVAGVLLTLAIFCHGLSGKRKVNKSPGFNLLGFWRRSTTRTLIDSAGTGRRRTTVVR